MISRDRVRKAVSISGMNVTWSGLSLEVRRDVIGSVVLRDQSSWELCEEKGLEAKSFLFNLRCSHGEKVLALKNRLSFVRKSLCRARILWDFQSVFDR